MSNLSLSILISEEAERWPFGLIQWLLLFYFSKMWCWYFLYQKLKLKNKLKSNGYTSRNMFNCLINFQGLEMSLQIFFKKIVFILDYFNIKLIQIINFLKTLIHIKRRNKIAQSFNCNLGIQNYKGNCDILN